MTLLLLTLRRPEDNFFLTDENGDYEKYNYFQLIF